MNAIVWWSRGFGRCALVLSVSWVHVPLENVPDSNANTHTWSSTGAWLRPGAPPNRMILRAASS